MPRSLDMSVDYEGSVEDVHGAFLEEGYWRARLVDSGTDIAELESIRFGGKPGNAGTVDVVTVQAVHSHNLPALVTQLHAGELRVRREESWGPVVDGVAKATVAGCVVHAPVSLTGSAELFAIGESGGSRLKFQAVIHVRVPLIGGKLEKIIGGHLADLMVMEQQFTTKWIADKA
jgi:Protein of unknown function (DUF2505)